MTDWGVAGRCALVLVMLACFVLAGASDWGLAVVSPGTRRIKVELDPDFLDEMMADVRESVQALAKSKAAKPKARVSEIWTPMGRILIVVQRVTS